MQPSTEQTRWLLKVLQPEKTLGSLPGASALSEPLRAALLGLPSDLYAAEQARMREGVEEAARALASSPEVASRIARLPLNEGARVVAFGDSHTSDPQSWAVILSELLAARGVRLEIHAVPGDTTTHGLIRLGQVTQRRPDWILFFIGTNDARTQGPMPGKTLVDPEETERNLRELRARAAHETEARCLWMTPPAVNEELVEGHWGLSRFGVRFRNEDVARVADAVRALGVPTVDTFDLLGTAPAAELMMDDGLHLTLAGSRRMRSSLALIPFSYHGSRRSRRAAPSQRAPFLSPLRAPTVARRPPRMAARTMAAGTSDSALFRYRNEVVIRTIS